MCTVSALNGGSHLWVREWEIFEKHVGLPDRAIQVQPIYQWSNISNTNTPSTDRNFKLKHNLINTHVTLTSYFLKTTLTNCTSWKPLALFGAPVQVGVHAAAGAWCCARAASTWHPAQTCVVFNFLLSPFLKIFSTSESFIKKRERKKIYIQGHKPKPFCCK